jgi:hypothetical protein
MAREQTDPTAQASTEVTEVAVSPAEYDPPRLVAVGNLNDILAGSGSRNPDFHSAQKGPLG